MSFSVALASLLWSHFHPYRLPGPEQAMHHLHVWLQENFNAGQRAQGELAWGVGALLPALALALLGHLLGELTSVLRWGYEVLVLYFCLGFREASFHAASIARALKDDDFPRARRTLNAYWPGLPPCADAEGVVRLTMESLLRNSLTSLFGILFWYFLLGTTGAVLYRLALSCRDTWHGQSEFGDFSLSVSRVLDWLPVRIVAFSYAIAGNFQDALESWRGQAAGWGDENLGILLAAGAGALGTQLGGHLKIEGGELLRPALGTDHVVVDPDAIDGAVALVWRAAILWLAVAGLLWLGGV